jgi:hypothetical protein
VNPDVHIFRLVCRIPPPPQVTDPYVFDSELFMERPWRKPGADMTDWFNYGFNEDTWQAYCNKQQQLRRQNAMQGSNIQVPRRQNPKPQTPNPKASNSECDAGLQHPGAATTKPQIPKHTKTGIQKAFLVSTRAWSWTLSPKPSIPTERNRAPEPRALNPITSIRRLWSRRGGARGSPKLPRGFLVQWALLVQALFPLPVGMAKGKWEVRV